MAIPEKITAPFSQDQALRLNRWQAHGAVRPFTCPNDGNPLIAFADGWRCSYCAYTQNWAHAFMLFDPPEVA